MDDRDAEKLDYIIASLMVYYKGAISYETFKTMPIPEILRLQKHAVALEQEKERAIARKR